MEIKLNTAYSSKWDNIQYPIFQLPDESYLCITYSRNHNCYNLNIYTVKDFEGFEEDEYYNEIFKNVTKYNIGVFETYYD